MPATGGRILVILPRLPFLGSKPLVSHSSARGLDASLDPGQNLGIRSELRNAPFDRSEASLRLATRIRRKIEHKAEGSHQYESVIDRRSGQLLISSLN